MLSKFRDPISGLTHLVGAILSVAALIILVKYSAFSGNVIHIVTFSIFGISLILLYSASSTYHLVKISEKGINILRKIDHTMIYILIAGTYTPVCLIVLGGNFGVGMLAGIWGFALLGIVLKILWFNAPRWLYTFFYVIMGWLAVIAIVPLARTMPIQGMMWLFLGGISYTVGAVFYALKRPRLIGKYFGFHEIFHVFVMMGSFCHFWLMLRYVMYI